MNAGAIASITLLLFIVLILNIYFHAEKPRFQIFAITYIYSVAFVFVLVFQPQANQSGCEGVGSAGNDFHRYRFIGLMRPKA